MALNRRSNQQSSSPFDGATMVTMTGSSTGSKMMTVSDLAMQPGVKTPYHIHPNTEESMFVVEGELEFRVDGHRFKATAGDCVLANRGKGHGVANVSDRPARFIAVYPSAAPEREVIDEPELKDATPDSVSFRGRMEAFEFAPGITRFDMVGDFLGAESTYFSELTFQPGAVAPNHYHPSHEESMFCLSGNLTAVYADDDNVPLEAGDMFTCEPTVRHGIYNSSDAPGKLLAIHPVLNPPPRVEVD
ncbi:MAG: cupin domain-containing protein [Dehalococcoidia bacterium]